VSPSLPFPLLGFCTASYCPPLFFSRFYGGIRNLAPPPSYFFMRRRRFFGFALGVGVIVDFFLLSLFYGGRGRRLHFLLTASSVADIPLVARRGRFPRFLFFHYLTLVRSFFRLYRWICFPPFLPLGRR